MAWPGMKITRSSGRRAARGHGPSPTARTANASEPPIPPQDARSEEPMYSNSAGVSYESDENPQLPDEPDGRGEAGHETELRRRTSYPKAPARTEPLGPPAAKAETLPDVMDETLPDVMDETFPDVMDDDTLPDITDEMPDAAEQPAGIDALLTEEEPANAAVPEAADQVTPIAPAEQSAPPPVITSMTSATRHGEGKSGEGK